MLVDIKKWSDKNRQLLHAIEEVKQQQNNAVMKLDAVSDDVKLCRKRLELIQRSDVEAETHLKEVFDNIKRIRNELI
jgi:chromosome segregation ATPase